MTPKRRTLPACRWSISLLLAASTLLGMSGCGVSQNPARIGNLPTGNIIRTHGKPPLWGNWRNFDPNAKTLTVTPRTAINQVGTQHVIVASVCDEDGNGRRSRRVEWHVTGVGYIVEVDESGLFPGRGYLVDDKYAVSYTNYKKQTITRGNADPNDDIPLRPGQTYCVIFSPEEGETNVTCYAPGIHDWQKHKVTVKKYWVDAQPIFPPPAVNRVGQPHTFNTRVVRSSDGSGASGYRVRYQVLDGPPAVFQPTMTPAVEVATDSQGQGAVVLQQAQGTPGTNRIQIEVVRPANTPTGREILISRHITTKTWVAPQISIQKVAPPAVAVGSQIPFKIVVTNTGSVSTSGLTIRDTIPPSLNLVGSNPPAALEGNNLVWQFGPLGPSQSIAVDFACLATQAGVVQNCAEAATPDGLHAESCASTQVAAGNLNITKTGPESAMVGQPIQFQISVSNNGTAPVLNVRLVDDFDAGLTHPSGQNALQLPVGTISPGETKVVPVTLVATAAGRFCNRVRAEGDGGITAAAEHCVEVRQPQLSIRKTGPSGIIIGRDADFTITVRNSGDIAAQNVIVRDTLPPVLQPISAAQGAIQGQMAIWNVGVLQPGQEQVLRLTARGMQASANVCNQATVEAVGVPAQASNEVCLNINGVPGLLTELIDRADPVPVGAETTYTIRVTNQGSVPLKNIQVECSVTEELEFVDAEGHPATIPPQLAQQNRAIRFKPFSGAGGEPGMMPGRELTFQIQARAVKPGQALFELRVKADGIREIKDQETTQCFDPNTGATGGSAEIRTDRQARILPAAGSTEAPIPSLGDTILPADDAPRSESPVELFPILPESAPTAPEIGPPTEDLLPPPEPVRIYSPRSV